MSWSGFSATSGSRLLWSMRRAASCCHPLQETSVPRGARMAVVKLIEAPDDDDSATRAMAPPSGSPDVLKTYPDGGQSGTYAGLEGLVLDGVQVDGDVRQGPGPRGRDEGFRDCKVRPEFG